MRECNLNCELQHEGCCTAEIYDKNFKCNAKTNEDLVCAICGKKECDCFE